jgi:hypothetical protein
MRHMINWMDVLDEGALFRFEEVGRDQFLRLIILVIYIIYATSIY